MRFYRTRDYDDMSRKAANILAAQIISKPRSVLGLATGSSPLGAYRRLVELYRAGDVDFSEAVTVNLDEYVGLGPDDSRSYSYYMFDSLFDHVNIDPANINMLNGLETDEARESARYDRVIERSGGIDMQLLGIGPNGHIGFNEPGTSFEKDTHRVKLTESTIEANKRFFASEDEVPRHAYTMGIRSIMRARKILFIASGEHKAEILHRSLFGPITPQVPASVLQLHSDVTVVGDEAAMSMIPT